VTYVRSIRPQLRPSLPGNASYGKVNGDQTMREDETRETLNYEEKREELIRFLASPDNAIMVLATAQNDRVLARNVNVASDGLDIYFFTWKHSRKCKQIEGNPRVALCKDLVQIEGVAEIVGPLISEETKAYTDILRNKFPKTIALWKDRPGMVIVRIRPTSAVMGGSTDDPCLEFLDIENETAYTERWAHHE
jgi:general stress protein 26